MAKEWEAETIFDVFGSQVARQILVLASEQPLSATELATRCEVSEPTVYRRIHALQDYGLVADQREVDDAGHHYKRFETTLDTLEVQIEDGQLTFDLTRTKDYPEKFSDFWHDLGQGATEASNTTEFSQGNDSPTDSPTG